MAEEIAMAEVMNLLEAEPAACAPALGPDIPALREDLAILVLTGKCKEAIGVNLTHEQVNRLEDKDVMRYSKRHEAHVGAKTIGAMMDDLLKFSTKALGQVVRLKDSEALQNELKNDYIINKELSNFSGLLALRYGRLYAAAIAFLITANNVDSAKCSTLYMAIRLLGKIMPNNPQQMLNNYSPIAQLNIIYLVNMPWQILLRLNK